MQYLIGYDIVDDKRLQRAYRVMIKFAMPLQYSLFLFDGTKRGLDEGIGHLLKIINLKEDDLRIYPLESRENKYWNLGKSILPDGIFVSSVRFQ
ncbi:CRISPR-associated endonuclease Cas2 [Actinobacillus equuli]|uniref:CRISPR-associated endonuclease Cas2 n=1 Tax=Actinobacillus equuli TaxID=718 RepID=UPI0024413EBF|nr:CRISPR-associated endonuclease Cas2 [Actinobacillus equuli]WGE85073.1 CRISPR-associated endonuclease Cas2 [Actinobacillus equuli subsp. haemolyticus]